MKNKRKILILICAIMLILIVGGLLFFGNLNKPKNIFLRNVNNDYKRLSSSVLKTKEEIKTIKTENNLNFNIDINEELLDSKELLNEINSLSLNFDTYLDFDKKLLNLFMNFKYTDKDLLALNLYGKPNSLYLSMKDIYDKYIEFPYENYSELFKKTDSEELKYIIKKIKDSIINNLDEKNFNKSKETININEKDVKVNKISYIFNEERFINLMVKLLKDIKDDEKSLEIISKLSNIDKEELISNINDTIEGFYNYEYIDKTEVEFIMYTKGLTNESIEYLIKYEDVEIIYSNYQDIIKILIKDNENSFNITNKKINDKSYNTLITIQADELIKLNIDSNKNNDTWTHNYEFNYDEYKVIGSLAIKETELKENKEYQSDIKLDMSLILDNERIFKLDINSQSNSKINEEFSLPDLSNSILYTDLKEEDTNTIMNNFLNNETINDFITKISGLIDSSY